MNVIDCVIWPPKKHDTGWGEFSFEGVEAMHSAFDYFRDLASRGNVTADNQIHINVPFYLSARMFRSFFNYMTSDLGFTPVVHASKSALPTIRRWGTYKILLCDI